MSICGDQRIRANFMSQKITLTMAGIRRIFFHSDIKPSRFHQRHRTNTKWCHYLNHTGESRFVFKRSLMRTVVGSFIFFLPHRYGLHFCDYVHTILQPNAPFSAHIRVDPVCIETCVPDQITYFSLRSLRIQFDWTVKRHLEIQNSLSLTELHELCITESDFSLQCWTSAMCNRPVD